MIARKKTGKIGKKQGKIGKNGKKGNLPHLKEQFAFTIFKLVVGWYRDRGATISDKTILKYCFLARSAALKKPQERAYVIDLVSMSVRSPRKSWARDLKFG